MDLGLHIEPSLTWPLKGKEFSLKGLGQHLSRIILMDIASVRVKNIHGALAHILQDREILYSQEMTSLKDRPL